MKMRKGTGHLLAMGFALLAAANGLAMPTKEELLQAQKLVVDLTADDLRAMKSGAKKPAEVAAAQVELAGEAETEAGKYLLLQGAFKLYARCGEFGSRGCGGTLRACRRSLWWSW